MHTTTRGDLLSRPKGLARRWHNAAVALGWRQLGCLVLLQLACASNSATSEIETAVTSAPRVQSSSRKAPPFELPTLDGSRLSLSDQRGHRVILVDFWATYCEPCLLAMPDLQRLYEKYGERGFAVWGVNIDGPESIAQVQAEVAKLGLSFPILLDRETRTLADYNPRGSAPFSALVDQNGNIVDLREGYAPGDLDRLESKLREMLGP